MTLYGKATLHGISGTVTTPALAMLSESLESEHTADVEEFVDGNGELLGFVKKNERFNVDLTLIPSTTTLALASATLAKMTIPSKVTLAGFPSVAGTDTVDINGDYIYKGGSRRSILRGQATLRLPIFRPVNAGGPTIDALVTAIV